MNNRKFNTTCNHCDIFFYKRPSQKKKTHNHYCSMSCYNNYKIDNNRKICTNCGDYYHPNKSNQKFCSLKCFASRPRSLKWNGNGKNKSKKIMKDFKNNGWDGNCMVQGCNYNKTLDLHRFIEGKNGGKYTTANTYAICPNHHAEYHRGFTKFNIISKFEIGEVVTIDNVTTFC